MWGGRTATLAVLLVALANPVWAQEYSSCVPRTDINEASIFRRYPAAGAMQRPLLAPRPVTAQARMFRTRLREGSRGTPNFAGRFSVVEIGCGAGALCPAIVDRRTGRVTFSPELRVVSEWSDDRNRLIEHGLVYRRDSALLIATGMINEKEATSGISYYHWSGQAFTLQRRIAGKVACR